MQKSKIKQQFETFLIKNKIPFEREVGIKDDVIDYKIELDGKPRLVEVKSDRANIFITIGQLLNAKRTCSDVFLLAPRRFINKLRRIWVEINPHQNIGFFETVNGGIKLLEYPQTTKYYFNTEFIMKRKRSRTKHIIINENDMAILDKFRNKVFLISEVANDQKVSLAVAQKRVNRLKRANLVEEVIRNYPKGFRIVGRCKLNEMIEIKGD